MPVVPSLRVHLRHARHTSLCVVWCQNGDVKVVFKDSDFGRRHAPAVAEPWLVGLRALVQSLGADTLRRRVPYVAVDVPGVDGRAVWHHLLQLATDSVRQPPEPRGQWGPVGGERPHAPLFGARLWTDLMDEEQAEAADQAEDPQQQEENEEEDEDAEDGSQAAEHEAGAGSPTFWSGAAARPHVLDPVMADRLFRAARAYLRTHPLGGTPTFSDVPQTEAHRRRLHNWMRSSLDARDASEATLDEVARRLAAAPGPLPAVRVHAGANVGGSSSSGGAGRRRRGAGKRR